MTEREREENEWVIDHYTNVNMDWAWNVDTEHRQRVSTLLHRVDWKGSYGSIYVVYK